MAKLRLVGWLVLVGVAGWWLLGDVRWSADPAEQVMAVVRAVAGALAVYLLIVTVAAVRLPKLAPAFVRRLVAGAVGTVLLAAPMTASATAADRPAVATEAPVLRRVDTPIPVAPDPVPAPVAAPEAVTIGSGEHLWLVAERELAARLGRPPTDAEVVPFWTAVIEANRNRLASGDPDLVFPGERVVLPS